MTPEKPTSMMYPQSGGRVAFKNPDDHQLRINTIVT